MDLSIVNRVSRLRNIFSNFDGSAIFGLLGPKKTQTKFFLFFQIGPSGANLAPKIEKIFKNAIFLDIFFQLN